MIFYSGIIAIFVKIILKAMNIESIYHSPEMIVYIIHNEGVLCGSGGSSEGVGENMGTDWDTIELLD